VVGVAGDVAGWAARGGRSAPRANRSLPSTSPAQPARPIPGPSSGAAKTAPRGRQLREAEREMARLQRQRDKITDSLTGASDHREMNRLGDELAAAQSALEQAEERWLMLAEATESGD
jgi:hypothetical protein